MRSSLISQAVALAVFLASVTAPGALRAEDRKLYPDQLEKRLKQADSHVLDLQASRFRALFAEKRDDEEVERLDKEFKEAQKERRELLKATGKLH